MGTPYGITYWDNYLLYLPIMTPTTYYYPSHTALLSHFRERPSVTMGIVVVFGTSMATILGVFLIPMLFILVEKIGHQPVKKKQTIGRLGDM